MISAGLDEVGPLIYGLVDPLTKELRYIGKSINGTRRARNHTTKPDLKRHGKTHKVAWVKSLLRKNLKPEIVVLLRCDSPDVLYDEEQRLIKEHRAAGARLTNHTDGGPGRWGYRLSDATKRKLSRRAKAQMKRQPTKHTKKTKEALRKLQLGRKHGDKARLNMSAAHGGRPFVEVTSGMIFVSQSEASDYFGWSRPSQTKVSMVLNGKKPQYKGKVFRYLDQRGGCPLD